MNRCFSLTLSILVSMAVSASADEIKFSEITFSSGQTMIAQVIHYENGVIAIRNEAGQVNTGPIERVNSIRFGGGEKALFDKRMLAAAEAVRRETLERYEKSKSPELKERLEKYPPAVVVLYIDTEDPDDELDQRSVEFRCYRGGGYSGQKRVPLRRPWASLEFTSPDTNARRIELNPGTPYKTKSIPVELKSGEVINLGRVVLGKDEADVTASPQGVVNKSAAKVKFSSGQTMEVKVLGYEDGVITVRNEAGKEFSGPIDRVKSIEFGNTPYEVYKRLLAEAERVRREQQERYKKSPTAAVAMYIDTEDPNDELSQGEVKCRFFIGAGFGSARIPLRTPSARLEPVIPNTTYRMELDPGPPYKSKSIPVFLQEGRVTNLGRIVLEKAKAEGTVSIQGVVKDVTGNPVPGAVVTAGTKQVKTDRKGAYKLNGFGLEVVQLRASYPGCYGGGGTVSIRDTSNRQIIQDLLLMRPRLIKLRYVVSDENSDSFVGAKIEAGTFGTILFYPSSQFGNSNFNSQAFKQFVSDSRLQLSIQEGKIIFDNSGRQLFYKKVDSTPFESIAKAGNVNEKACPPLGPEETLLIRGFRDGKPSFVKVLIEDFSVVDLAEFRDSRFARDVASGLREGIYNAIRRGDWKKANRELNSIMELSDGERTVDGLMPLLIFGGQPEAYVRFRSERLNRYKTEDEILTLFYVAASSSLAPYARANLDDARLALRLIQLAVSKPQKYASLLPLFGLVEALAEYRLGNYDGSRQVLMGLPVEYQPSNKFVQYVSRRELLLLLLDIQQSQGDSYQERLTAIGERFGNIGGSLEEGGDPPDFSKLVPSVEWQTCQLLYYEAERLLGASGN